MDLPASWIPIIQNRVARAAIGASTARGQRAPGLVAAARRHLAKIDLNQFAVSNAVAFSATLDHVTRTLEKSLPKRGQSFGIARKMLNIFLRDSLYVVYLRSHYHLDIAEPLFELPLDSYTAKQLRRLKERLPSWQGVKRLTRSDNERFQEAAAIADEKSIARVHLDAEWWAVR